MYYQIDIIMLNIILTPDHIANAVVVSLRCEIGKLEMTVHFKLSLQALPRSKIWSGHIARDPLNTRTAIHRLYPANNNVFPHRHKRIAHM